MNIVEVIKKRQTTRTYKHKTVSKKLLYKILEAARLAPSPHNAQPWFFIIIHDKDFKKRLITILDKPSESFFTSAKILFQKSIEIIKNAPIIILVYNTHDLLKKMRIFGEPYSSIAYISEIEGISAAIENMHLTATSLGVGMAWLTTPLILKQEINNFLNTKDELVAVLTLGYPNEKSRVKLRKKMSSIIKFME